MKRVKVLDITDAKDFMTFVEMQKLDTKRGKVNSIKHLTVYNLFIGACSKPYLLDMLEMLGVEARKVLERQSEELGKLAMQAAKRKLDGT